jgi:transcriptional regulator with XRE-family HTH domain
MGILQNAKRQPAEAGAEPEGEIDMRERIARNLITLRNQRGLSLMALSARAHVSYWTLQEVELAHTLPTIEALWKVAHALGVPCDAFVEPPLPADQAANVSRH